jgi:hypothetical protein
MPSRAACVRAGVPNSGKSAWLDALAVNLAERWGWRVAFASFEKSITSHAQALLELTMGARAAGRRVFSCFNPNPPASRRPPACLLPLANMGSPCPRTERPFFVRGNEPWLRGAAQIAGAAAAAGSGPEHERHRHDPHDPHGHHQQPPRQPPQPARMSAEDVEAGLRWVSNMFYLIRADTHDARPTVDWLLETATSAVYRRVPTGARMRERCGVPRPPLPLAWAPATGPPSACDHARP